MSTNIQKEKKLIGNGSSENAESEKDPMQEMNKNMSWLMPIMSISIAFVAPLGLALYWLVNNILMILERILLNKFVIDKEEETS